MKNKKGFTLIELLAVIVILAIIALIAVPIILNMIKQARMSAAKSSALGYIDAIEYNNGFAQIEQEGYTAVTSGEVSTINTTLGSHLKGKAPTSGTVTIDTNGKVTSATNLCFNGYAVTYENNDVSNVTSGCSSSNNNNNNNNEPSISEPESFATDSWETIANNTTSSVYEVGNEKTIQMDVDGQDGPETYHIMIVNKTPCTTETSQTACGLVLQFKEVLNIPEEDDKKINLTDTNEGGWPGSKMRTYLNTAKDSNNNDISIYSKLPNDLRSKIINTTVKSGYGGGSSEIYTSTDKIYLLSAKEVGITKNYDKSNSETRKLDYYLDGESVQEAENLRIKHPSNNSTSHYWWTRTAYTNSKSFIAVTTTGSASYADSTFTYMMSVAPAFRIGVSS